MKTINTSQAPAAIGPYVQAKLVGNLLFVSGQIPLSPETGEVVGETIEEQTKQVLSNLEAILAAAGTGPDQIVKTTCFLTDLTDFARFNSTYQAFFGSDYPARSAIEVARLPRDVKVEIEAIALVPN